MTAEVIAIPFDIDGTLIITDGAGPPWALRLPHPATGKTWRRRDAGYIWTSA